MSRSLRVQSNYIEKIKSMEMVGGHPYLVAQAFSQLKFNSQISLNQLLEIAATEAGLYGNHLRHLWPLIKSYSKLIKAFNKVVNTTNSVRLDSIQAYKLHSMGLVHLQRNEVIPGCNLYRQYFIDKFSN